MVTKHGMDTTVGQRTYAARPQPFLIASRDVVVSAAEATAREIDLAVRQLVEEGDASARQILEQRRADLEAGAALLIAHETLTAEEFAPLCTSGRPGRAKVAAGA
jgi:cell division protease FtsH